MAETPTPPPTPPTPSTPCTPPSPSWSVDSTGTFSAVEVAKQLQYLPHQAGDEQIEDEVIVWKPKTMEIQDVKELVGREYIYEWHKAWRSRIRKASSAARLYSLPNVVYTPDILKGLPVVPLEVRIRDTIHSMGDFANVYPPQLLQKFEEKGYTQPTPIQSEVWRHALMGCDLVGVSETGSGKTLAFLIPAFLHANQQTPLTQTKDGPLVLIVEPTRELAQQVCDVANSYTNIFNLSCGCIIGGIDRQQQIQDLTQKPLEILVATPGRLIDLLSIGIFHMRRMTFFVLDEADRLLDLGFLPQLKLLKTQLRPDRQSMLLSATWDVVVQALAADYVKDDFQFITIGSSNLRPVSTIKQHFHVLPDENAKEGQLSKVLKMFMYGGNTTSKILVFVRRRTLVDDLCQALRFDGWDAQGIHGGKLQEDRQSTLKDFSDGRARILVTTDLASRGWDIQGVTHVINFSFPQTMEDYVHRVGRTARAGRTGEAHSFLTTTDAPICRELIKVLERSDHPVPEEVRKLSHANVQVEDIDEEGDEDIDTDWIKTCQVTTTIHSYPNDT
eukprot:m.7660 g.7660  ORF g.7660 m.7660 type:complete len:558 (+) comp3751_c0_seq1:2-1675(+)